MSSTLTSIFRPPSASLSPSSAASPSSSASASTSASSHQHYQEAVLITNPRCTGVDRDGVVTVEGERCETIDLNSKHKKLETSSTTTAAMSTTSNPLFRFLESSFGAERKVKMSQELDEISSSVVKLVPTRQRETVAGGFDICREYSYSGDEDENNYFNDSDTHNKNKNKSANVRNGNNHHHHATTKNEEEDDVVRTHLLGKTYHPIQDYNLRRDFESNLYWFTYRCNFPEIVPYNITSDAGWGCMLRSAQMLLAQALRVHYKGSRDWKPPHLIARRRQDPFVRSMMTWFADFPSTTENLYSIHNMVATGLAKYDKLPGEWYGPGTVCYVLRDLVEMHERQQQQQEGVAAAAARKMTSTASPSTSSPSSPSSPSSLSSSSSSNSRKMFRVYVASQASVYRDAIEELMTRDSVQQAATTNQHPKEEIQASSLPSHPLEDVATSSSWEEELIESVDGTCGTASKQKQIEWDTALLLLIPLRLGLKSFNEDYVQAVAHTFSLSQSVGGLGGRPRSARWFYGALSDGSKIFGLDPHTVQNAPRKRHAQVNGKHAVAVVDLSEDYLRSVHTTYPEVFSLQKMDPSIALGFYCKSRADLENLFSSIHQWHEEHDPHGPELFTVADKSPDYYQSSYSFSGNTNGGGVGTPSSSSMMEDNNKLVLTGSDSMWDGDNDHQGGQLSDEEDEYVVL